MSTPESHYAAFLKLGATVLTYVDNPPDIGDVTTVVCQIRCTGHGMDQDDDGVQTHYRKHKLVAAWIKDGPQDSQPTLIDREGELTDAATGNELSGMDEFAGGNHE